MATLTQPPAPVPTGSDIPTYSQVPETTFDRKWFNAKPRVLAEIWDTMLTCNLHIVDWADLATLDLSLFDQPGGKEQLAKQLFEAIQNIGQ